MAITIYSTSAAMCFVSGVPQVQLFKGVSRITSVENAWCFGPVQCPGSSVQVDATHKAGLAISYRRNDLSSGASCGAPEADRLGLVLSGSDTVYFGARLAPCGGRISVSPYTPRNNP